MAASSTPVSFGPGLLQITGYTEAPRDVKIRYKLASKEWSNSTPGIQNHYPSRDEQTTAPEKRDAP